jgi:hypothetical protein
MASLLLDTQAWDLCLDANLNIATCQAPYCNAQDAACHVRLFQGELRYDTSQGMPYWQLILGHWPSVPVLKAYAAQQALLATGVETAQLIITSWSRASRQLFGAVLITNGQGQGASVSPFAISAGATSI